MEIQEIFECFFFYGYIRCIDIDGVIFFEKDLEIS